MRYNGPMTVTPNSSRAQPTGEVPVVASPMWELVASACLLVGRTRHPRLRDWTARQRSRVPALRLRLLPSLLRASVVPHFLTPPVVAALPTIDDELATIAAIDVGPMLTELGWAFGDPGRWQPPHVVLPDTLRVFLTAPECALETLVEELRRYWDMVVAPGWSRVDDALRAEVRRRGGAIEYTSAPALNASYRIVGSNLAASNLHVPGAIVDPADGAVFVVSAYSTIGTASVICPQPGIVWGPRSALLPYAVPMPTSSANGGALASVVGAGRAAVLLQLTHSPHADRARSTTEVAASLRISPAAASQHLTLLYRAGLADRERAGAAVRYRLSPSGTMLLAAFGEATPSEAPTA